MAEWFRRQPAELLYMGSIPIPGFSTETLYQNDIFEFLWYLRKQGYKETTIKESYSKILKNLTKNCDLNDPEVVSEFIANKHVSCGRKLAFHLLGIDYDCYKK